MLGGNIFYKEEYSTCIYTKILNSSHDSLKEAHNNLQQPETYTFFTTCK